ncbi:MAG TPA: hypothetical protein VGL75_12625 [Acidothermaceae bacterium]|jgi:hypothetical protein
MTDPVVVPADALRGVTVAFSVSESADLGRLGLTREHCDLVVAELARAVILAGGAIIYGGRLRPDPGFSSTLLDEAARFAAGREVMTLCLAEPEHRKFEVAELADLRRQFGLAARLVCLDADGDEIDQNNRSVPAASDPLADQIAYSSLRRYLAEHSGARVIVGGQLAATTSRVPGVLEEALLSLRRAQPLFVAGGFGGAAAAVAKALGLAFDDGPPDLPAGDAIFADVLNEITQAASEQPTSNGLTDPQRRYLAVTHRPGDIASLTVLGLSMSRPTV